MSKTNLLKVTSTGPKEEKKFQSNILEVNNRHFMVCSSEADEWFLIELETGKQIGEVENTPESAYIHLEQIFECDLSELNAKVLKVGAKVTLEVL